MDLNKEIEVFTEEKEEELPKKEAKPVQTPTQPAPPEKIQTPPKTVVEKPIITSNEVAVVNQADQALVWSKEKTGPERVRFLLSDFSQHFYKHPYFIGSRYRSCR